MSWVDDNKGAGPWPFVERGDVFGYLNNKRWSSQADAIAFCQAHGLPLDLSDQHLPCGHWHKGEPAIRFSTGKWVAAMPQPGTPYIYLYDILLKAVIKLQITTSGNPSIVETLLLDSAYALDYDIGRGNPGTQRGAYCMNKDGTRAWYLFCDQGLYPITRDHPDAQLVEVDISKTSMRIVKRTSFPGLLPAETFPDTQAGRVNDGCSDDTHTYWCTQLVGGRIIKIRNSDHSIVDDHTFNYAIEGCSAGNLDEAISTIDVNKNTGKLYWVYCRDHALCSPAWNACRHFIRSDADLTEEIDSVACASGAFSPAWQNMIRFHSNYLLHHRSYHPSTAGYLMKRDLDCTSSGNEVTGTDGLVYSCIKDHVSGASSKPITGGGWSIYWAQEGISGGVWVTGTSYFGNYNVQEYLQNILGIKNDRVFTLMCVNSLQHPAYLYCLDFSDMTEILKLDVSYYAGQIYPAGGYDWDWTSVSAMNKDNDVIIIVRYHNIEKRNYVACFKADSTLEFLSDDALDSVSPNAVTISDEPQVWTMPG